jgi:hypothetical protein
MCSRNSALNRDRHHRNRKTGREERLGRLQIGENNLQHWKVCLPDQCKKGGSLVRRYCWECEEHCAWREKRKEKKRVGRGKKNNMNKHLI